MPEAKRQKMAVAKIMPVILPPESHEIFTAGKLFDYLCYTKKIFPTNGEYRHHVKATILSFKGSQIEKLTESSVNALDKKVGNFVKIKI